MRVCVCVCVCVCVLSVLNGVQCKCSLKVLLKVCNISSVLTGRDRDDFSIRERWERGHVKVQKGYCFLYRN